MEQAMSDLFDDWINDPSDMTLAEYAEEMERRKAVKPLTPEELCHRHMMQAALLGQLQGGYSGSFQQAQQGHPFGGYRGQPTSPRGGGLLGGILGGLI
jgi:hypothetical protein